MNKEKITVHQLIWYIVIFSIVGLLIETTYGYITTGVIESRKGLILGPFCPIYGVGAAILIILLKDYKKSKINLFFYGALVGTIFEYICSYVLQIMYLSRFWDYSYTIFQINGRISLTYTIFWGILSVILISYIKPFLDKYIKKIPEKNLDKAIIIFLIIDVILTILSITIYMNRAKCRYENIKREDNFLDSIFTDEIMSKSFPNLRYINDKRRTNLYKDIFRLRN